MPSQAPILILPGWRVPADRYRELAKLLSKKGKTVKVIDFPGFGTIAAPEKAWNLDNFVDYVKYYISRNKLNPAIIIGHSFGGRVGIRLAATTEGVVRSLILTGTPGLPPVRNMKRIIFYYLSKLIKPLFQLPLLNQIRPISRRVLYRLVGSTDYLFVEGVMKTTFQNIVRDDLVMNMKNIKIPTLMVWGRNDSMVSYRIAMQMKSLIKNSELKIIANRGHGVLYEFPDEFIHQLQSFL